MRWVSEKGGYKWSPVRIAAVTLLVLLSLSLQSSACYIGDLVWNDLNGNGIQDPGETGVYRVKVELYKCGSTSVAQTAYTNTNGLYGFYVDSGRSYYVKFVLPSGYAFTKMDQGSDDAKDSDADVTTGKTICTYISAGEVDKTWDAGIYKPASIGDYVWYDKDCDGIQDAGEEGVANVRVELYTCAGTYLSYTTTNAYGIYKFTGLAPGDYKVRFILPEGYTFTKKDQGSDEAKDSDADPQGYSSCVTLRPGDCYTKLDAGIYKPAAIGDHVWHDLNNNGIQDAGEAGVANVKVDLYTCAGTFVASTHTDASGLYRFTELVPGDYKVKFFLPSGYAFTKMDQGSDDARDSDADVTTGTTACTSLACGETDNTWDAGIYRLAGLGNYVWDDVNRNGIQDDGETGVGGVQVELYTCTGTFVASTSTSASGLYEFTGLQPGDYTVKFILPSGYSFTLKDQGPDDAKDSDADSQGNGPCVTLVSGEFNDTLDAGLVHNNEIPEFPTIALPMAAILGLAFVFMRRK